MDYEFDEKRAFISSVILSGILANSIYDPPRRHKIEFMCDDAVNFADCLIKKLHESTEEAARADDADHRNKIIDEVKISLLDAGLSDFIADDLIGLMLEGEIKHVSIKF